MQIKSMTITAMDEAGKGLALLARLPEIDSDGDTYEPDAFSWKPGGHQWAMMVPAHNRQAMPFGKSRVFTERETAFAELHLNLKTSSGRDWHEALLFDLATGDPVQEWSFGYEAEYTFRVSAGSKVRVLSKVDVDEVSPVLRGAGNGTRTVSIKGAKLREDHLAGLLSDLGELASAIDADPASVSATGIKQLGDIRSAIDRVLAGGASEAEVKAAVSQDTALTQALQHRIKQRRFTR